MGLGLGLRGLDLGLGLDNYQRQNVSVANVNKVKTKIGDSIPLGQVDTVIILHKDVKYNRGHQNETE